MKQLFILMTLLFSYQTFAQRIDADAIDSLEHVYVRSLQKKEWLRQKQNDEQSRTERILSNINGVNIISRGNYAQEVVLRGMSSGQISVTIDGMRMLEACTDRMDPITSYVEPNNLDNIQMSNSPNSSIAGTNIGGGLNFTLRKAMLHQPTAWHYSIGSGWESNAMARQVLGNISFSSHRLAWEVDAIYRKADNYTPGGNKQENIQKYGTWNRSQGFSINEGGKVNFSQYEKWNVHTDLAYIVSQYHTITADFVRDDASNVGYPALTMDVAFAKSNIVSIGHEYSNDSRKLYSWRTKLYFNEIKHAMDDSKRPPEQVDMHMDMPGYTKTKGAYSQIKWALSPIEELRLKSEIVTQDWTASMTMYPNSGNMPMYMLTIPNVRRRLYNFSAYDTHNISDKTFVEVGGIVERAHSEVLSLLGKQTLSAIYSGELSSKKWAYNLGATIKQIVSESWTLQAQFSRSMRLPTLREQYGYYLYNRVDNYDYIGNPGLKNETAWRGSVSAFWKNGILNVKLTGFGYWLRHYINASVLPNFDAMTVNASGVKHFRNIDRARIVGGELSTNVQITSKFIWSSNNTYQQGIDGDKQYLPLISPFKSNNSLNYVVSREFVFFVDNSMSFRQNRASAFYGETVTPAFDISSVGGKYSMNIGLHQCRISITAANIFNKYYFEHIDGVHLPRMGRNVIVHVTFDL